MDCNVNAPARGRARTCGTCLEFFDHEGLEMCANWHMCCRRQMFGGDEALREPEDIACEHWIPKPPPTLPGFWERA